MGILKKIEKKLENAVEGVFAKGFKSKVEPVELGKKMATAMINGKVVALKKAWAPNEFEISLSAADDEQYKAYQKEMLHELQDYLIKEATAEGLSMVGRPKIIFKIDENLAKGQFSIKARLSEDFEKEISKTKDGATQLIPIEEIKAQIVKNFLEVQPLNMKYDLKDGSTFVGRSATCDISVVDPALSRRHFEIFIDAENEAIVKDLNSTNGTMVNGKIIKSLVLKEGDQIQVGDTIFVYRRSNV